MIQQTISYREPDSGVVWARRESDSGDEDRSRLLDLLDERLRFESLLARLSATFIHLPADRVDSQIERGLQQIVEFLGIERSGVAQFSESGRRLTATHDYAVPGYPRTPSANLVDVFPWYAAKVREGNVLRFDRLPDDMPAEAVAERQYCVRVGMQSQLTIPFRVGDEILGGIGFASFHRQRDWPDELVQSLQLLADIFANAQARKRADVALRESEGRFRRMTDTAPVMVWMSGPDKRCSYFNKPWLDFTGRPLHCELGDGWCQGVHAEDLKRCLNTYVSAFDARHEFRIEYRLRRFDGEYRWILDSGVPRFGSDGAFEGYVGSCIDITDRKRAEEALRESEARLRFLLESTHAIPWVAEARSWRLTYVGPQASNLLGYPMDAWYGENFWLDHVHPDDRAAALAFRLEHSHREGDYELDYRMLAADGRTVWIHDIVNVVAENGVAKWLRGFTIDVTARRRAEEESRVLREQLIHVGRVSTMGVLAASIAHEVNQPLCAIVSNAQAIQRMLGTGGFELHELLEALQDIAEDSKRASAVVAGVRGFLRKDPAQRSPVDVNALIREVAALMRGEMAKRGVAVTLDLAKNLPAVLGDRVQIQQVVLNLVANGADAMDHVAVEKRVLVLRSTTDTRGAVTVSVRDAGSGIDPWNLDRVFDAFFTTKTGGIGMGLAICKSIVEAHGGRIGAGCDQAGGTTFRVTLPAAPLPPPPGIGERAESRLPG